MKSTKKPIILTRDVFRRAREAAGLTQCQLAEKVGISQSMLNRFENGTIGGEIETDIVDRIEQAINEHPKKFISLKTLMRTGPNPFSGKPLVQQIAREMELEQEAEEKRLLKEQAGELRSRLAALEKEVTMLRAAMNKRKPKQRPKQRPHPTGQDELSENHLAMADRF
jgi:transcriptional regulator with XRE-family HTH domain